MFGFVLFLDSRVGGQEEVKIDRKHFRELKSKFVFYGYNPKQTVVQERREPSRQASRRRGPKLDKPESLRSLLSPGSAKRRAATSSSSFPLSNRLWQQRRHSFDAPEEIVGAAFNVPTIRSWDTAT